jgi:hypothetical protein
VGGAVEELARARDPAGVALGIGAGILKVAGGCWRWPWSATGAVRSLAGCCSGVVWAASAVLTAHGGLLVAVETLVLTGIVRPAGPVDRTALWWHVLVWDLWFLVWGLLLGVAAWHHGRASRDRAAR